MDKRAQQQPDGMWKVYLFIFAFILAGVLIYFAGKLAITLGLVGIIIGVIFLIAAANNAGDDFGYFGLLILVISLALLIGGLSVTNFFENNEIGKVWLGSGKTIINTTAQTYQATKGGFP